MESVNQDMGHWNSPWEFDPADWVGFTYRIYDLDNQRQYIGKKLFHSTRRVIQKLKKNRKRITKESNWRKYCGSSKELLAEIAARGEDRFRFTIESLHESRSTLAWTETFKLVTEDALRSMLPDGVTKKYYNGIIGGIKYKVHPESAREAEYKI